MVTAVHKVAAAGGVRIAGIDGLRGVAIVAMVAYHFSWDLDIVGLAEVPLLTDPFWLAARAAILSGFLVLVGVGQALAFRAGHPWPRAAWRLGKIAAGAALVTAGSFLAFPDAYIFFGVLHHILIASVLCLLLAPLPGWLLLALAAACLALPHAVQAPAFAQAGLLWTGLAPWPPASNDYVPIFPWLGVVLAGLAWPAPVLWLAARLQLGRPLAWAGRHSLAIYLLHQPILLALLGGVAWAAGSGIPLR